MSTNRYLDLINNIPKGEQYQAGGYIIPKQSGPTSLRFVTTTPNTNYLVTVNNSIITTITTDIDGVAFVNVQLPNGDVLVQLQQQNSTNIINSFLTTRDFAVWYAAYGEQLEAIDTSINNTLASFYLAQAVSGDLDQAHGARLLAPNASGAELEAYREILQLMRQSARQFAGRLSGKMAAVAAITQVNPYIFKRRKNGPRWVLGYQFVPNFQFQDWTIAAVDLGSLATQINSSGQFVTLLYAGSTSNIMAFYGKFGVLNYFPAFNRFTWTDNNVDVGLVATERVLDNEQITTSGIYSVFSGRAPAIFTAINDVANLHTPDGERFIYLDIDGNGKTLIDLYTTSDITLSLKAVASTVLAANNQYRNQLLVSSQCGSGLQGMIEVVRVYQQTSLGGDMGLVGNPQITYLGTNQYNYQSPTDGFVGATVNVVSNAINRLYSNNGEWVDIFVGSLFPPSSPVSDTFTISRKLFSQDYESSFNPTSTSILDTMQITSGNKYTADGPSSVTIYDGPGSRSEQLFGLPAVTTTPQAGINAGDTTITVPAGATAQFNQGIVGNYPFDIIVGRGWSSSSSNGAWQILFASGPTFTIHTISGAFPRTANTHILLNIANTAGPSFANGIHKVLTVTESGQEITCTYSGKNVSPQAISAGPSLPGFFSIGVDPSTPAGTGFINYIAGSPNQAQWKAPGDSSFGPLISLTNPLTFTARNGWYRLPSNNGHYIDVIVDQASTPGSNVSNAQYTVRYNVALGGFPVYTSTVGDTVRFWNEGELNTVISSTPSGPNEIWTLNSPVVGHYPLDSGNTLQMVLQNQLPQKRSGVDNYSDLQIQVDTTKTPASFLGGSQIYTADIFGWSQNNYLPDGWQAVSPYNTSPAPFANVELIPDARFNTTSAMLISARLPRIGPTGVKRVLKLNPDDEGFNFTLKAWVRNYDPTQNATMYVGFDFGSGLVTSTPVNVTLNGSTNSPQLITFTKQLPPGSSKFEIQVLNSQGDKFIIDQVVVIKNRFTGLYLGDCTIPRSGGRAAFGELFYVWCPDQLNVDETAELGIAAPVVDGLIREFHNTFEQIDAFDISDFLSGVSTNVRGMMYETDWLTATLTNMVIVGRQPSRFSYVKPTHISQVTGEVLSFASGPSAALAFISDANQNNAILYQDGIPMTNDTWTFPSGQFVMITSGFNPTSVYTIDYNILIQMESAPIDLQSPPNNGTDTWFVDYLLWNRHVSTQLSVNQNIVITFDSQFDATLPKPSDSEQLTSILVENNGTSTRTVPRSAWRYVDVNTINIDSSQFNDTAVYNFQYNQQITNPARAVDVLVELRSATTEFGLFSTAYRTVKINDPIDNSLEFHQIRVTLSNVQSVDDVRLYTAVVKGFKMSQAGSPPGFPT